MSKFMSLSEEYSIAKRDYNVAKSRAQDCSSNDEKFIFYEEEKCASTDCCRDDRNHESKEKGYKSNQRHDMSKSAQTEKHLSSSPLCQDATVAKGLQMLNAARPSLSVINDKHSITVKHSEIENSFVVELKTAGLRGWKEKKVLDLFHQICLAHHESAVEYHDKAQNLWKNHADECITAAVTKFRLIEKDLTEASRARGKAEDTAREVIEAQEKLSLELQDVKRNFERALEEAEQDRASQVDENQRMMGNFIVEMEAEAEKMKLEVLEEAKQANLCLQAELESEHKKSLVIASDRVKSLTAENKKLQSRCDEQEIYFSKKICELEAMARSDNEKKARVKKTVSKLEQALNAAETTAKDKTKKIKHLKYSLEQMKQEKNLERNRAEEERKVELENVEHRVKLLLEHKDRQIRDACNRAQQAENRVKLLEKMLSDLESGFVDVSGVRH